MKIPLYQIDAFTDGVFKGNPAAVCPLKEWLDKDTMLNIAAENNLSETAFFVSNGDSFELKWFTPKIEIDLCGHATLATAYVIFNYLKPDLNVVKFMTNSGELIVNRNENFLIMNLPSSKPEPAKTPPQLIDGLKATPIEVLRSRDYLAIFSSEDVIRSIKPDFGILKGLDCLGIIISAIGDNADFVSRFFAPGAGINEDPVTGSAHATLIPYWSNKLGKKALHAFQISERQGEIFCKDLGDRVEISGQAITYLIGEIEI